MTLHETGYIQNLLFVFLVWITLFWNMLPTICYLLLGHLLLGSILNHLMHSKDVEYVLMFLSATARGVEIANIYVPILPLHHL